MLLRTLKIRVEDATLLRMLETNEFGFDDNVLLGVLEACGLEVTACRLD